MPKQDAAPWQAGSQAKGTSKGPAGRRASTSKTGKTKQPTTEKGKSAAARNKAAAEMADAVLEIVGKGKRGRKQQNQENPKRDYFDYQQADKEYTHLTLDQLRGSYETGFVMRAEAFVREYLKDYKITEAYLRVCQDRDLEDMSKHVIYKMASRTFWHPYTQRYLSSLREKAELASIVSNEALVQRAWEEANNVSDDANAASRVGALKLLMKARGLDKPQAEQNTKGHSSGVMIVPYLSFQEWSDRALAEQTQLKEDVMQPD